MGIQITILIEIAMVTVIKIYSNHTKTKEKKKIMITSFLKTRTTIALIVMNSLMNTSLSILNNKMFLIKISNNLIRTLRYGIYLSQSQCLRKVPKRRVLPNLHITSSPLRVSKQMIEEAIMKSHGKLILC